MEKRECAFYALPFNPYGTRQAYNHPFPMRWLDMRSDSVVLIGEDFWDKVGGPGTWESMLEVAEEVGAPALPSGVVMAGARAGRPASARHAAAFDRFDVPTPGPVLIIVEESGRAALHRRLDMLTRGRAIDPELLRGFYFAANRRVRLDRDEWRERLLEAAAEKPWRLIAVDAAGVRTPATPYDMRDTFASNALHAGVTVFELARVMGTSVRMIERHYGTLVDGAHAAIADRLDALEANLADAADGTGGS